jgi:flavin reductase (DIM6/NTAB) family NADH-FMN oxidoreductase RutF
MLYEFSKLDWKRSYKLLASTVVPRPIAWVVTLNEDGGANAAPFSFFNYFSGFPPVVCLGMTNKPHGPHDSLVNIRREGEFIINLVAEHQAQAMNTTAMEFPPLVSEVEAAGLTTIPSTFVRPPRIADSPVALECRLVELKSVLGETGYIVLAQVLAMHINDDAIIDKENCYVDTPKLGLIGRMESPGAYVRTTDRFFMKVPPVSGRDEKTNHQSQDQK